MDQEKYENSQVWLMLTMILALAALIVLLVLHAPLAAAGVLSMALLFGIITKVLTVKEKTQQHQ